MKSDTRLRADRTAGDGVATIAQIVRSVRRCFIEAGIPSAQLDARLLACAAAGLSHEQFIAEPDRPLDRDRARVLDTFVSRRLHREPVSRILGEREFWGRRFEVTPQTLDPRGDTETLIEAVLEGSDLSRSEVPAIADLGTGTGCLLVSLLCEYEKAVGVGVDFDRQAVATAQRNAEAHGVDTRALFICGNWLAPLRTRFDLIVSNPPYVRSGDIAILEPEVARYEPHRALDGGTDGLDCYRKIVRDSREHLNVRGILMFELGAGQDAAVAAILEQHGYRLLGERCDLSGVVRCLWATPVS